jgi:hypothetical protein
VQTLLSVPEAASVAAGRVLAHAALQAFSHASISSQRNRAAYELFDLAEQGHDGNGNLRVELICEKLEQLLLNGAPDVPWQDVRGKVDEFLRTSTEHLLTDAVCPSTSCH